MLFRYFTTIYAHGKIYKKLPAATSYARGEECKPLIEISKRLVGLIFVIASWNVYRWIMAAEIAKCT